MRDEEAASTFGSTIEGERGEPWAYIFGFIKGKKKKKNTNII